MLKPKLSAQQVGNPEENLNLPPKAEKKPTKVKIMYASKNMDKGLGENDSNTDLAARNDEVLMKSGNRAKEAEG